MNEIWTQWKPIEGLSQKYDIDDIFDTGNGFIILLSEFISGKNKTKVIFEKSVDSYIKADESFRLSLINNLDRQYGVAFYGHWTFFKVTNSEYFKRLSEQSSGISDYHPFIHFSFLGANAILDVIATYEPKVELIEAL